MRLTVFDFDGTLTWKDSFTAFIRRVRGTGGLAGTLLWSLPAVVRWKLGGSTNEEAKRVMFRKAFKGVEVERFREEGRRFADEIDTFVRPEIVERLHEAVERGDKVVIVSASVGEWIRPWAGRNGVSEVIATRVDLDGERMSGEIVSANCHGEEKVRRLTEEIPDLLRNRRRWYVTAYGDSSGDDAMLAFADEPHRVPHHRSERLRKFI